MPPRVRASRSLANPGSWSRKSSVSHSLKSCLGAPMPSRNMPSSFNGTLAAHPWPFPPPCGPGKSPHASQRPGSPFGGKPRHGAPVVRLKQRIQGRVTPLARDTTCPAQPPTGPADIFQSLRIAPSRRQAGDDGPQVGNLVRQLRHGRGSGCMPHLQALADLLRQRLVIRNLGHDPRHLGAESRFEAYEGGRLRIGVAVLDRVMQRTSDDGHGRGPCMARIPTTSSTWFT